MTEYAKERAVTPEVYIGQKGGKYIRKMDPKTGESTKIYLSKMSAKAKKKIMSNLPPEVPVTFRIGKNSVDGKILEPMSHVDITLHLRHYPLDPFQPRPAHPSSNNKIANATSHGSFIEDKLRSDFPGRNTHVGRIEVKDQGLLNTHHISVDHHGNPTQTNGRSWKSHAKTAAESSGVAAAQKVFDDIISFAASTDRQNSSMSQLSSDFSKTFLSKEYAHDLAKTLGSAAVDGLTTGNAGGQVLEGAYKAGAALYERKWGKALDESVSSGGTALATGVFRLPLTAESTLFAGKVTESENAGWSQDRYGASAGISVFVIPTLKAGVSYYQELQVEGNGIRETFQTANVSGSVGESIDVALGVGIVHTEAHQEYVIEGQGHTEKRLVRDVTGRQHRETLTSTSANILVQESSTTDSAVVMVQGRVSDRLSHASASLGTLAAASDSVRTTEDGSALHVRSLESRDSAMVSGVQVDTEQTVLFATMKETHHESNSVFKSGNADTLTSEGNYAFVRAGNIPSAPGPGGDGHITGSEHYQEVGAFSQTNDLRHGTTSQPESAAAYAYTGSAEAHLGNRTVRMEVQENGATTRRFEGGGGGVRGASDAQTQKATLFETADAGHSLEVRPLVSSQDTASASYNASMQQDVRSRRTEIDQSATSIDGRPAVVTAKTTEASGVYNASAERAAKDGSYRTQRTENGTFHEKSASATASEGKLNSVLDKNLSGAGLLGCVNNLSPRASSAQSAPATTTTEGTFRESTHVQSTHVSTGERMQREETSRGTVKREVGPDGGLNKLNESASYAYKETRQKSYADVLKSGAQVNSTHSTEITATGTRHTSQAGRKAPAVTREQQTAHVRDIIAIDSRSSSVLGLCKNHTTSNQQVDRRVTQDRTLIGGAETALGMQNHLLSAQSKSVASLSSHESFLGSRLSTVATDFNPFYAKRTESLKVVGADGRIVKAATDTKYTASVHTKAAGLSVGADVLNNVLSSKEGRVSAEKVALNAGDAFATSLGKEVLSEKIAPVLQNVIQGSGAGFVTESLVNAVSGALHGDAKQLENLAFGVANKVVSEVSAEVLQSTLPVGYSHSKTIATKGFGKGAYESKVHRDNVDVPLFLGVKVGANFETSTTKYEKNGLTITRKAKGLGVSGSVPAVNLNVGISNAHEKAETKVERIGDEMRTTDYERKLTGALSVRLKAGDREGFKDVLSLKSRSTKVVEVEKADGTAYCYRDVAMKYLAVPPAVPAAGPGEPPLLPSSAASQPPPAGQQDADEWAALPAAGAGAGGGAAPFSTLPQQTGGISGSAVTLPAASSTPALSPGPAPAAPLTRAQQTSAAMHKNIGLQVDNSIKTGAYEKVLKQRSVTEQKRTLGGILGSSTKDKKFEKGERLEQTKSASENMVVGDELRSTYSSTSVTHEFMDLVQHTTKSRNWYGKKKYHDQKFARGENRQYEKEVQRVNANVRVSRKADFSAYETGTSARTGSGGEIITRKESDFTQVDADSRTSYAQTGQSASTATMHRHGTYKETTTTSGQSKSEVDGVSLITHIATTSAELGTYVDLRVDSASSSTGPSSHHEYARGENRESSEKLQTDYVRAKSLHREDYKPMDPKPILKDDQTVEGVTGKADMEIYSNQKLVQGQIDHTTGSVHEGYVKTAVGQFSITQSMSKIDHSGEVMMNKNACSHSTTVDHEVRGAVSYTLEEGQSVVPGTDTSLAAASTTTAFAALEKDMKFDGEFKGVITKDTYTPVKDVILKTDDSMAGRVVTEKLLNHEDVTQQWSEIPRSVEPVIGDAPSSQPAEPAAPPAEPSQQPADGAGDPTVAGGETKSRLEMAGLAPETQTRTTNILHITDIETQAEIATVSWNGVKYESATDRKLRMKQEKSDIVEGSGDTAVLQNTVVTTGDVFDASSIKVNKEAGWLLSTTTTTVTPKDKEPNSGEAEAKVPAKPTSSVHVELSQGVSRGVSSAAGSVGNIVGKAVVNQVVSWSGGTVDEKDHVSLEDVGQGALSTLEGGILGTCTEWAKAGSKMESNGSVVIAVASGVAVVASAVLNHMKRRRRAKKQKQSEVVAVPGEVKTFNQKVLEGAQEVGSIALDILPSVVAVAGAATKYAAKASGVSTKLSVAIEAVRSGYHYAAGTKDENGNDVVDGLRLIENVGNATLGVGVSGAVYAATAPVAVVAATTATTAISAAVTAVAVPAFLASFGTHLATAVYTRAMAWFRSWWTWSAMNKEYSALCVELSLDERTVTETQINKAYRKMGLKYHPDSLQPTRSEEKFVELSTNYKRLLELYTQLNKGGSMSKLYSAIVHSMDIVKRNAGMTWAQWDAWLESLLGEAE